MGPLSSCWCSGVQKVLNGPGAVRESEAASLLGPPVEDGQEAGPFVPGVRRGVAAYALDPQKAARLWQLSLDLLAAAH